MSLRKQVLLVAMLDSIHTARWLEQFVGEEVEFTIFPSKKFKNLHPSIHQLIKGGSTDQFNFHQKIPLATSGFYDYLFFESWLSKRGSRQVALNELLLRNSYDYIHALEIQGAGYLLANSTFPRNCKTIISNWGSDIYFYRKYEEHLSQIKQLLTQVDAYSAECIRDYNLAKELGFKGILLPCIPNAGGHSVPESLMKPMERNQIIIKGYGGTFGRAIEVISIASEILDKYQSVNLFIYSLTKDNYAAVKELKKRYGDRVSFQKAENRLSHSKMQLEFQKSRIYIGSSISDGISTSFLEALANGAYPIQTNTSCANEWVEKGALASLVNVDRFEILREVNRVINDRIFLEDALAANRLVALENLDSNSLKIKSRTFYRI
ncbi:GT4_PimA-like domain containing protein [Candidatus Nanopelagicaceae bacterium]